MRLCDPLIDPTGILPDGYQGKAILIADLLDGKCFFERRLEPLRKLRDARYLLHWKDGMGRAFTEGPLKITKDLVSEYQSVTKYFTSIDQHYVIYDCPRDNLAIIFLRDNTSVQFLEKLDALFVAHVNKTGIGFGSEGKKYLCELVQSLVERNLLDSNRPLYKFIISLGLR